MISELHRAASLLDGTTEDTITFFDETRNKEQQESTAKQISQMQRKYKTIIDEKSAENEEQKKEIDLLRKK